MKKINLVNVVAICMCLAPSFALGASAAFSTTVNNIFIDDTPNRYAGCMARLNVDVNAQLNMCAGSYVTMDCTGELGTSKTVAQQKLSAMQLALVSGTRVRVTVIDTKTASGHCLAQRIDNFGD